MPNHPVIERVEVDAYTIPTDQPEEDGTLAWDETTIVVVHAHAGNHTGLGYTYADLATAKLIESKLAGVVGGLHAGAPRHAWAAMVKAIRNLGRPGIGSMAISAVDVALWDLHSRLLEHAARGLLGAAREAFPCTARGVSRTIRTSDCRSSWWAGFRGHTPREDQGRGTRRRTPGGSRCPGGDRGRVRTVRGRERCVLAQAGARARSRFRQERGVSWFEEPVSSDDLAGLRLLRDHGPEGMEIAAGEYGYVGLISSAWSRPRRLT